MLRKLGKVILDEDTKEAMLELKKTLENIGRKNSIKMQIEFEKNGKSKNFLLMLEIEKKIDLALLIIEYKYGVK